MDCPKCGHPMEQVVFADVEVDRCTLCKGLWFDLLEHERLKAEAGSESIDTGEFTDYKHHTLADLFRRLGARERR